jgi:maleate isomerase
METEIPALLRAREAVAPERFTFHSARMRMKTVSADELKAMDADSDRCALELSDAAVDVLGYACLVAIMAMGHGYHRESEARLHRRTAENGHSAPVVTSAGALVEGLHALGARRIAVVAPYMRPLTDLVVGYIENEGIAVADSLALEITDNLEVAAQDPARLLEHYRRLDLTGVDALVLSACVQMPSLASVQKVEDAIGLPVVSAAICTAHQMLKRLGLETHVPGAGALLSGKYQVPARAGLLKQSSPALRPLRPSPVRLLPRFRNRRRAPEESGAP